MGMVQPWLPCLVTDLSAGCMLRINISETKPFCNINYCLKRITQLTCACYTFTINLLGRETVKKIKLTYCTVVSWRSLALSQSHCHWLQTQCSSTQLRSSVAPSVPHWQCPLLYQSQWTQQSMAGSCRLGQSHTGLYSEQSQWTQTGICRQLIHYWESLHLSFFQLGDCLYLHKEEFFFLIWSTPMEHSQ